jgi:hypothetical protein
MPTYVPGAGYVPLRVHSTGFSQSPIQGDPKLSTFIETGVWAVPASRIQQALPLLRIGSCGASDSPPPPWNLGSLLDILNGSTENTEGGEARFLLLAAASQKPS